MRYQQLVEDYKTVKTRFIQKGASEGDVDAAIAVFRAIQNRLTGNEKNIDWWGKQGWEAFQQFVKNERERVTRSQERKATGDYLVLRSDDEWLITMPMDCESAARLGSNTDWCVSKLNQNHFSNYFFIHKIDLIFLHRLTDNKKWAISVNTESKRIDIYDQEDDQITPVGFKHSTGLSSTSVINLAKDRQAEIKAGRIRNSENDLSLKVDQAIHDGKRDTKLEQKLIAVRNMDLIEKYIREVLTEEWLEVEPLILKNKALTIRYVERVKKQIPSLEITLSAIPRQMTFYFTDVLASLPGPRRIDPVAEKNIATDAYASFLYAKYGLKGPFPAGEEAMATDARLALRYAVQVLAKKGSKGARFELAEPVISADPVTALSYAEEVLHGPFPAGEEAMATDASVAYDYAEHILKGRFLKGEPAIATDKWLSDLYAKRVVKGPFPVSNKAKG